MKNRVAYLITAYKDAEQLLDIATLLSTHDNVYIHVDKKSREITDKHIEQLNLIPNCKAIKSYEIAWGGYSHIEAFLTLMKLASMDQEVSYIHMLTAQDYPLRNPEKLHERFLDDKNIYLDYLEEENFPKEVTIRYRYYNLFQNKNVKNPLLWQLQNFTTKLQKLFGIHRKNLGEFHQIYKGLVYISMPSDVMDYILEYSKNHKEYCKDLYRCQIPEEIFFHTIILNSPFAERVVKRELRFMDWNSGNGASPMTLDMSYYDKLKSTNCCFARKFELPSSSDLQKIIRKELWSRDYE